MIPQDTLNLKQAGRTNLNEHNQDSIVTKKSDTLIKSPVDTSINLPVKSLYVSVPISNRKDDFYLKELNTEFCNKTTADIISYYSSGFPVIPQEQSKIYFPYGFIESSEKFNKERETRISEVRKDGIIIEKDNFKSDWMLPLMLISLLVYLITYKTSSDLIKLLNKFFTLRITHDSGTIKISGFSSLLFDLISYINISLFAYAALFFFNISTGRTKGYFTLMILFILVVFLSSARLIVTFLTGAISEQREIFAVYGRTIKCFYRSAGLILFFIITTFLYTKFFSSVTLIYGGFAILLLLYFIRMINLFLIFIRKRASVLYLILYLCALEILPIAILVKFVIQLLQNT